MKRKYNFSRRSDVRRFQRDLEHDLKAEMNKVVKKSFDKCLRCGHPMNIHGGTNVCPSCGFKFVLK